MTFANIQIISFEINLRKEKWLVASIYKAPSQENKYFLWYLTNLSDFYSIRYEKVITYGDFNIKEGNKATKGFLQEHMFYVLQYDETEYMFNGGSCIDLLINYNFGLFIYEDKFL